jgi:hypothetical protein
MVRTAGDLELSEDELRGFNELWNSRQHETAIIWSRLDPGPARPTGISPTFSWVVQTTFLPPMGCEDVPTVVDSETALH